MDLREFVDSLNNLDWQNVGGFPLPVKMFMWILAALCSGWLVYYMMLSDSLVVLEKEEGKESGLMQDYEKKAFKCPKCGSRRLERLISTFQVKTSKKS